MSDAADAALAALETAELAAPDDPALQERLALAYAARGRTIEATAAHAAALALAAGSPLALFNLATTFFSSGHYGPAEKWYRRALAHDPGLVEAHQNLAVILDMTGRPDAAEQHREAAYRRRWLFVEPATGQESLRVLVLAAGGLGNVPIEFLWPRDRVTRIKWFVAYDPAPRLDALPPFDLVFNAIGDPDLTDAALAIAETALRGCDRPVLNPPARVRGTRRDQVAAALAGIPDLVVPAVWRVTEGDWRAALAAPGAPSLPAIARPLGSHGGRGAVLARAPADLDAAPPPPGYLTEFHDLRAADGRVRKYRMIFVDRRPLPYHLAIGDDWLVHYVTADMESSAAKRAEEARFLEDPAAAIGPRALAAIGEAARRLDLDYGGIDFGLLPDGRALLFEANALMLVHLRDDPALFDYRHRLVPRVFAAFDALAMRRLGREARP